MPARKNTGKPARPVLEIFRRNIDTGSGFLTDRFGYARTVDPSVYES